MACIQNIFSLYYPCTGHLDYLQCLSTTNNAAMNIPVNVFLWIWLRFSSAYKLKSRIAGSYTYRVLILSAMLLSRVATCAPAVCKSFYNLHLHQHLVFISFANMCQLNIYEISYCLFCFLVVVVVVVFFLAALGPYCCTWAFSSCSERGLLFIAVHVLLIAVASLVAEHGL